MHDHAAAARALNEHEDRVDGAHLAASLSGGLALLSDLLFTRVHLDVEANFGLDSMIMPLSPVESERRTKAEIELFQVAVCAAHAAGRRYVRDADWFAQWLAQLRLGDAADDATGAAKLATYRSLESGPRRLAFERALTRAMPESARAPLVLYRLFPLAVRIATSTAFGDHTAATELRGRQSVLLPAISACRQCGGDALDNGSKCDVCGNPLWTYERLTATD